MELKQLTTLEKCAVNLAQFEQAEMPIAHLFVEGQYLRELDIPKDTIVIGKRHKCASVDILLAGSLILVKESIDGKLSKPILVEAPYVGVSEPGTRKIGRALSDVSFLNTFATLKTTVEEVENEMVYDELDVAQLREPYGEHTELLSAQVLSALGVKLCQ